jgi:peptidylamidoglycolate lyase
MKFLTAAAVFALATMVVLAQDEKGGTEVSGPYEAVSNWPTPLHSDYTWGRTASVFAESPDRVYVIQTGELPKLEKPIGDGGIPVRPAASFPDQHRREHILMVFDRNGTLVESWEQHNHLFINPHSNLVSPYDRERHVWVVDDGVSQIFKFTRDGKLVMTLGERQVERSDKAHFAGPTDLEFLPNGDFFVSDGYRNTRIVRFSSAGQYLAEWGQPGSGPGEFNTPHSIALDAQQRVYVADRGNSRIQVFDTTGEFLDQWPNVKFPLYIAVSRDQHLWVSDGMHNKFLKYNLAGRLLYSWGTFGGEPGQLFGVHSFSVDQDGNFYTAEVWGGRAQKFTPRRGADRTKLIDPLLAPLTH